MRQHLRDASCAADAVLVAAAIAAYRRRHAGERIVAEPDCDQMRHNWASVAILRMTSQQHRNCLIAGVLVAALC